MFAPTFSLEAGSRQSTASEPQKTKQTKPARRARGSLASVFACLLTLGMAVAGHAQNAVIDTSTVAVSEGSAGSSINIDFQVSLAGPATAQRTVYVSTVAGTATAGQDFEARSAVPVVFPIGTSGPITVSVPIVGDDIYEPNNGGLEQFSLVEVADDGNGNFLPVTNGARATATIRDDDPLPLLSISDPAPIVEGTGNVVNLNFTISATNASSAPISVTYTAAADPNAQFSAAPGVDFQNTTGTAVISPGATETTITVPIIGDTEDETTETFLVNLSNPVNADIAKGQGVGTITDNDGPSVRITDVTQPEGDDFVFQVTLSAPSPETIEINYTTAPNSAEAATDYVAQSGILVFPANSAQPQEITIATIDDNIDEPDEEIFLVNLSGASGGVTFADGQGRGVIQDNDDPPLLSFARAIVQNEGDTGTTTFVFTVNLTGASTRTITVDYDTTPGSPNPASVGSDYQRARGT
ncbi:MAG: hypothetical protein EOP14_04140, partial [Pseudomonas sp.]